MKPNILAISGSLIPNSSNNKLLSYLKEEFTNEANIILSQSLDSLPHFNPTLDKGELPESIMNFRKAIASADAILISTPEYVFSMPAVLKNALEWCVSTGVFTNKSVGIIVGAASGQKAMEQLVLVLSTIQCKLSAETQLVISGIKGKVNPAMSGELQKELDVFMDAFLLQIEHG
ncbi:NADPH-dependent FMN reductase [uncultured Arcticibacterium sp.]|uniref:NADPH-dependent FMN reductase n=1 Tax=uncultured Arcticibacterium sp. TaxID=2173042 RepID=UPI0030F51D20